ncbi:hypothetical protein Anas_03055 [Armadillidium nasatum]|uniref:Uncharacterized protein n=1 Tax=Armadillidium nasatum TaxID=96803 RepID=A0A5N5SHN2_9CRUS|nr:hypothetical protein Anas_03055 [Armadillidium nasatum]
MKSSKKFSRSMEYCITEENRNRRKRTNKFEKIINRNCGYIIQVFRISPFLDRKRLLEINTECTVLPRNLPEEQLQYQLLPAPVHTYKPEATHVPEKSIRIINNPRMNFEMNYRLYTSNNL